MPLSSDTRFSSAVAQVAIVGTDAVLAARPATAVQLAHACQKLGFAVVVPASWGDELIAAECVRQTAELGVEPAVLCACPHVTSRLLAAGAELAPFFVSLVSPPVAAARYVRRLYGETPVRITFIGACPGAEDQVVDERLLPHELLALLEDEGIALSRQPTVFDSVIPPDRRRFASLPGGAPSPDRLREQSPPRTMIEIDGSAYAAELAQHLLAGDCVLADLAPRLGCSCSGAVPGVAPRDARAVAASLDPMRAPGHVVELALGVDVRLALPPRVEPLVRHEAGASARAVTSAGTGSDALMALPLASPRHNTPTPRARLEPRSGGRTRSPATGVPRFPTGTVPVTRTGEGKPLPRAYVAARRTPPGGRRRISGEHPPSPAPEDDTPAPGTADRTGPLRESAEQTILVPRFAESVAARRPAMRRMPLVALAVAVAAVVLLIVVARRGPDATMAREPAGATALVAPSPGSADAANAATSRAPSGGAGARTPTMGPHDGSRAGRFLRGTNARALMPRTTRATAGGGAALVVESVPAPAPAVTTPVRAEPASAASDSERATVLREIERRRARVDSLARRIESLPGRPPLRL